MSQQILNKTFQSTQKHRVEDIQDYLRDTLKDATGYTVTLCIQRTVPVVARLKPWDVATEDAALNKTVLAYYVSMLTIIRTQYNDDSMRRALLHEYIQRYGIRVVMDVLRSMMYELASGTIPDIWRAHFPDPEFALRRVKEDARILLTNPENLAAYQPYMTDADLAQPTEPTVQVSVPVSVLPTSFGETVKCVGVKPAEPTESAKPAKPAQPVAKPVRLRSYGYSIGLNDTESQRVLRRAVEAAGFYNVLAKMEFLLRVWDKYPCMTHLKRDHAFVLSLGA